MILETKLGQVHTQIVGRSDEGKPVYEIHSVPYAHAGRFERPVPVECYAEGKPINREDTVCFPQHGYPLWANRFMKHHMMRPEFLPLTDVQTEDAFVVNIWTDDLEGKKPVAVFIHGGGEGSGTVPVYTGAHLAEHGVVAVTITYRIGCFGYSPVFDGEKMTANLAYFDQQAALQWVNKNIQYFGGDAENIALMGHCGGGLACLYHLLNPVSNKFFHKLIIFAGNLPHMTPKESARETFLQAMKKQKCETKTDLLRISAKTLVARKKPLPMGDVIDGDFFTDDPEALLDKGAFPDIPILIGSNADEFSMIELPMYYKFMNIATKEKDLDKVLQEKYGNYAQALKDAFASESESPVDLQTKIMELLVFHNSAYQLMRRFSGKCAVYGYRLHYVPTLYDGLRGSYHGAELALFFDNMDKMGIPIPDKNKEQTRVLQQDWLCFIKTGEIPGRERFDQLGNITDYDDQITSVPFPKKDLIEEVNEAGLCRRAREGYIEGM